MESEPKRTHVFCYKQKNKKECVGVRRGRTKQEKRKKRPTTGRQMEIRAIIVDHVIQPPIAEAGQRVEPNARITTVNSTTDTFGWESRSIGKQLSNKQTVAMEAV